MIVASGSADAQLQRRHQMAAAPDKRVLGGTRQRLVILLCKDFRGPVRPSSGQVPAARAEHFPGEPTVSDIWRSRATWPRRGTGLSENAAVKRADFGSEQELQAWLHKNGIDTSQWGIGVHKSIGDLWREYRSGESVLREDPPGRATSIVTVIIRRGGRILIEAEQTMTGGRRRGRDAPPMEKMKPGESVRQAALRCVREELGIVVDDAGDVPASEEKAVTEQRFSVSYPGLPTHYTFYEHELDVPGLPDGPFTTEEAGDAVKAHLWQWRERE